MGNSDLGQRWDVMPTGVEPPPIHTGSVRDSPGVWRGSPLISARCMARMAVVSTVSDRAMAACMAAVLARIIPTLRLAFMPSSSASATARAEAADRAK